MLAFSNYPGTEPLIKAFDTGRAIQPHAGWPHYIGDVQGLTFRALGHVVNGELDRAGYGRGTRSY